MATYLMDLLNEDPRQNIIPVNNIENPKKKSLLDTLGKNFTNNLNDNPQHNIIPINNIENPKKKGLLDILGQNFTNNGYTKSDVLRNILSGFANSKADTWSGMFADAAMSPYQTQQLRNTYNSMGYNIPQGFTKQQIEQFPTLLKFQFDMQKLKTGIEQDKANTEKAKAMAEFYKNKPQGSQISKGMKKSDVLRQMLNLGIIDDNNYNKQITDKYYNPDLNIPENIAQSLLKGDFKKSQAYADLSGEKEITEKAKQGKYNHDAHKPYSTKISTHKNEDNAEYKQALSQFVKIANGKDYKKTQYARAKFIEYFGVDPLKKLSGGNR